MSHTPGPWQVEDFEFKTGEHRIKSSGYVLAKVFGMGHSENQANARLIAAAPQLLEAARAVMDALKGKTCSLDAIGKLGAAIAAAEKTALIERDRNE